VHRALFALLRGGSAAVTGKVSGRSRGDTRSAVSDRSDDGENRRADERLLRSVEEKIKVSESGKTKLEEEQKALGMQFVLERTKQETVCKHIEAGGIADYQAIISKGLNAQVIEWKGIGAAEKLAESPNAKVIIVGSD
jgi:hypothetical protein